MLSAALVGLALLGVACSDDKAELPTSSAVTLATSAVRGIAVFPNAVPDPAASTPGREVFRVARSPEDVISFYRNGVGPAEATPENLEVCTRKFTPPYELTWRVADTNDFVVVQAVGDGATPPGSILTIIDDKANTTRTCTTP